MIKKIFKQVYLIIFFLFTFENLLFSEINLKILYKINDQIITNIDLENEKKFLIFLNPNLKNLSNIQIKNISLDSLKNRKIKEIELNKYFDLKKENLSDVYISNFITNTNYQNLEKLKISLQEFNLKYSNFEKNLIIDNLWREFIFKKFKSKIKINEEKLRDQLSKQKNEIEELNLSEILFEITGNESFENKLKEINTEIKKSGFEAAASIYSISESKNYGGNLGWIRSNQISEKIYLEIKKGKEITNPIETNNGYLIIRINERRKYNEEIDLEKEFKRLVNLEKEKELNKLGYMYFNKIKKRTYISEN
tara:strand:- start:3 stop:929 length:927 start_codon:yes stop_codon:yes gene_type:complete